jgi:2-dehydropantoate 2-reductase
MRVLIVGAGAIGRFMAARLKLAGHNAVLLARPDGAAQLAAGFTFAADGKQYKIAVPVATAPDDAALHDPFELAVMAVKSFSTPGAIESVRGVSACERATILTLQNGIGNEELCAAAFGDERVVAGALTTAVDKAADGSIVASSKGGLSIAPLGKLPHNWLLAVFENSAIKVAAAPDWRALKWSKLCINLQANAVCAVLDWTPEQVYADKTAFSIERRCLLEAFAVMSALGITPIALIDFPVPLLIAAARTLPEAMLRPVLAHRRSRASLTHGSGCAQRCGRRARRRSRRRRASECCGGSHSERHHQRLDRLGYVSRKTVSALVGGSIVGWHIGLSHW